ncbi:MAG: NfeD family protein [Clostridiales bacterium]|nr:NfeD family protein [Clostridiales bacterium]
MEAVIQPQVFWLIIFVIMVVIELATMGLVSIWFAAGALVALLLGFTRVGFPIQTIVCLIVAAVFIILVRPVARKHFNHSRVRTNAQSLIGESGVVMEEIDNLRSVGRVNVKGQEWAAMNAAGDEKLPEGTSVIVREIRGVKLIVDKKD